jgi:Uma2 family endonuclease
LYPGKNEVSVYRPDSSSQRHGTGDVLSIPELLPGFELSVARIFED